MKLSLSQILALKRIEDSFPGQTLYGKPVIFLEQTANGALCVYALDKNGSPGEVIERIPVARYGGC